MSKKSNSVFIRQGRLKATKTKKANIQKASEKSSRCFSKCEKILKFNKEIFQGKRYFFPVPYLGIATNFFMRIQSIKVLRLRCANNLLMN